MSPPAIYVQVKSTEYFDDEEGDELCNCEFSLAYGAKILLNNAALRLKRGRRYGLCGPNGVGKVRYASFEKVQLDFQLSVQTDVKSSP